MGIEEEIKLTAPALATLDEVATDPEVVAACGGRPPVCRPFFCTYLDTPDLALLRGRLALRIRREPEGGWRVGVKGSGNMVDGVSRREEWEMRTAEPPARLRDLPPGPARERVLALADPEPALIPLVTTDFQRRMWHLGDGGDAWAELALDQGTIQAGGRSVTLFEVEVELLKPPFARVEAFARALSRRHPLTPSAHSKFSLGLSLLDPGALPVGILRVM